MRWVFFPRCPVVGVSLALALALAGLLAGDAAFAAEGQPPNGLVLPLVVTQLPVGTPAEKNGPQAGGMLRADYGEGARLILLEPAASAKSLSAGFHSACDPDVSFDGRRVLFSGKRSADDAWNIYELSLANLQYRRITRNLGDCRHPSYQSTFFVITENEPWAQIGFVSRRAGRKNEYGNAPATALYTCKLDGSLLQQITYNLSSDYDPAIMDDGRLLYATWRRATFDDGVLGRIALEGINVDGSDRAAFVPGSAKRIRHMPCATSVGLVVFVEADTVPWDGAGQLASVAVRRPLHTYRPLTAARDGLFHTPSALPDGRILVSVRPADASGSHGLFCMDVSTLRLQRVFDDPRYHEIQAKAIVARRMPDGRSSVVSPDDPLAELYCMNVSTTEFKDRNWLTLGTAKRVRLLEGLPASVGADRAESRGGAAQLAARRILGEVPVQKDGSLHLIVPANTPIQLQLLDGRGLALRSCGWIWARSHQAQGCIGCHEDPELTPHNYVPESLQTAAASVAVPVEDRKAVDFRRDVLPIVQRKCLPCHGPRGDAPQLTGAASDARDAARGIYDALLARDPQAEKAAGFGKYVHPGRARTSPLVWHAFGKNTAGPWDGPATAGEAKPIPSGKAAEPLTDDDRGTLAQWIDTGAAWETAMSVAPATHDAPSTSGAPAK
jgi:hypothetical protein